MIKANHKNQIVLFWVLFVCKFVLYYFHRVSTQLQLANISYHIVSYHIISVQIDQIWSGKVTLGKLHKFPSHYNPVRSASLNKSISFVMQGLKHPTSQNLNEKYNISPALMTA
jgi:hypothetical protein